MPAIVRGGGGISRKSDGEIFEASIPAGTVVQEAKETYYPASNENIINIDENLSGAYYKGAWLMSDAKTTISQYVKFSNMQITQKFSIETDIVIADIREFVIKIGRYTFDISFGKKYFDTTINIYALLQEKGTTVINIMDKQINGNYLTMKIQKGVIKEISIAVAGGTSTSGIKTKLAIDIKINTVSRSIIDATAVPADVKKGKIFYNSKGRQIGTMPLTQFSNLKMYEFTVSGTMFGNLNHINFPNSQTIDKPTMIINTTTGKLDGFRNNDPFWGNEGFNFNLKIMLKGAIIYIEIDGHIFYLDYSTLGQKGTGFRIREKTNNSVVFDFYHNGTYLYVFLQKTSVCAKFMEGKKIKLYYKE